MCVSMHVVDTLLEAYEESGRMAPFVAKLLSVLLACMATPYSHELRSDAVKLAPRYLATAKNTPHMRGMAEQLLKALTAILDEGRQNDADAVGAESGVVGTAAQALLERLKVIPPALVRALLGEERLAWTIDCMFACVARAM